MTVTSRRHAQAEESLGRAKKWKREEEAASNYETQDRKTVLTHGGALPREAETLRARAADDLSAKGSGLHDQARVLRETRREGYIHWGAQCDTQALLHFL